MTFIVHNVFGNLLKIIPYAMLSNDYDCSFTVLLWNNGMRGRSNIHSYKPTPQPSGFLQLFLTQILIIWDSFFLLKVHSISSQRL
jgi:hypothetical protein